MSEFNNLGNQGWYRDNKNVLTFSLGETGPLAAATPGIIDMEEFKTVMQPIVLNIQDKYILIKGTNNRLPEEIESVIGTNRILPELIEKQTRMLYGKGPKVYREDFVDGKLVRTWEKNQEIEGWINSWIDIGLQDDIKDFCEKIIHDYYYFEDFWIKWRFFVSRRLTPEKSVAGLEHIDNKRCRLATEKNFNELGWDVVDGDFNNVVIGNWMVAMEKRFNIYNRFRMASAAANSIAVSYHKNNTVGQIYGYNHFYLGIRDWLTGTNRNPKYINSYLENSLNAKVHVIIPRAWVDHTVQKLTAYCDENQKLKDDNKELIKPYGIEIGTEYSETYLDKYLSAKLEELSTFLSGVSNQGKLYASISYYTADNKEVAWQIVPLDLKYREFITALIDYDKRADEVITTALGIDSALSNVTKDGVISKSGSDAYYNYMIYLHNLPLAEHTCCQPFNWAIKINFPQLFRDGYRIGFYNEVPQRQEDVSPTDRLQNTVNRSIQNLTNQVNELKADITKMKEISK